jgi:hypothetical protein
MIKQRVRLLEKKFDDVGGGTCGACYSANGGWGWVPLFRPNAGESSPYGSDERCTRCGAEARDVIQLVTDATVS